MTDDAEPNTMTYREVVARLTRRGLVDPERRFRYITLDAPFDPGDLDYLLEEAGIAVCVHPEVDDLEEGYHFVLERFAACAGRSVTEVRLRGGAADDGGDLLSFRLDGEPRSWKVEHQSRHYLDTLTVFEDVCGFEPGGDDARRFFSRWPSPDADDLFVLATEADARWLQDELGLDLRVTDTAS